MDDATIVASLLEGDTAGLAEAYRNYADRLFTYSASVLRDRDAAADIVHDTFVIAADRIGQLRDPDRLRPWLYAIARNECLRTVRARGRSTVLDEAGLEEAGAVSDQTVELGADLRQDELRQLVWTAADGLNPREREVLELSVRHQLEGAELAAALGVPANHAHALLSKARQQLERALAALIVARTGRRDCGTLDGLLSGWDGAMSVLLRKRVARHIESCSVCAERKRRDVSATALLGMTPLLVAPLALRDQVLRGFGDIELVGQHTAIAGRAGRFDHDGFPIPLDRPRTTFAWQAPALAAAGAAVFLLSGVMLLGEGTDTAADIAAPPAGTQSLLLSPSPSPAPSPSTTGAVPSPTTSTEPEPSDPPTAPPTSESPLPPVDLLDIHCPTTPAPCEGVAMPKGAFGSIALATKSSKPINVHVAVPAEITWISISSREVLLVEGQRVTVRIGILKDAPEQCTEMMANVEMAVDNGHLELFKVSCEEEPRPL